jgi:hypothetical protein
MENIKIVFLNATCKLDVKHLRNYTSPSYSLVKNPLDPIIYFHSLQINININIEDLGKGRVLPTTKDISFLS